MGVIRNSRFFLLRQICVLYTIHLSILSSILYFRMAVQLTLPILVAYSRCKKVLLESSIRRVLMHTDPLFKNLMILKLEEIYYLHPGKCMYPFNNNLIRSSFSRSILRTNQVHDYNTRSSSQFYIPFCRTCCFLQSQ